jgi:hypothetical protein
MKTTGTYIHKLFPPLLNLTGIYPLLSLLIETKRKIFNKMLNERGPDAVMRRGPLEVAVHE